MEERIPAEFDGVRTDVIEAPRVELEVDTAKYSAMKGGIQIAMSGNCFDDIKGTLVCIATDNSNQKKVILSNAHVLFAGGNGDDARVGQPTNGVCCDCCIRIVARNTRGIISETVDGGIATLDSGVSSSAEIVTLGAVKGTHDVTATEAATHTYAVVKRGRTTEVTHGYVQYNNYSIFVSTVGGTGRQMRDQLYIVPQGEAEIPRLVEVVIRDRFG